MMCGRCVGDVCDTNTSPDTSQAHCAHIATCIAHTSHIYRTYVGLYIAAYIATYIAHTSHMHHHMHRHMYRTHICTYITNTSHLLHTCYRLHLLYRACIARTSHTRCSCIAHTLSTLSYIPHASPHALLHRHMHRRTQLSLEGLQHAPVM